MPEYSAIKQRNVGSEPVRPGLRFLFKQPAHFIALGLGSGLCPVAPGTAGTLFAWISFDLIALALYRQPFYSVLMVSLIIFSFFIGLWACKITAHNMRLPDPGPIVWDEIVAFWLVLYILPFPKLSVSILCMQAVAFVLFRVFDAVKKGPVKWADEKFAGTGYKGAFGIMIDDIVAAFLTLIVLFIIYIGLYLSRNFFFS